MRDVSVVAEFPYACESCSCFIFGITGLGVVTVSVPFITFAIF